MGQLVKTAVIAILLLFFSANQIAFAAPDATCDVPTTTHATIQAAVDDATCSTINITTNGVLHENVTIERTAIIRGAADDDNHPLTIVDGQKLDSVFTVNGSNTVVFRNLVIRHGATEGNGGGIFVVEDASVTLDNVIMMGNSAENGGGIYAHSGFLNIINSQLIDNRATKLGGGIFGALGSVDLRAFGMSGNSAEDGGAIGIANASLILNNGDFTNNSASRDGGALFLTVPSGVSRLINLRFEGNAADNLGGAVFSRRGLVFTDSQFDNNQAVDGGGIYIERNSLSLIHTHVSHNRATGNGGGVHLSKTLPGFVVDAKFTMSQGSLTDNTAVGDGGGIYVEGDIDTTLNEVGILRNSAENNGGGLAIIGDNTAITKINGSILQANTAGSDQQGQGGAASIRDSAEFSLSNSYVANNNSQTSGGAFSIHFVDTANLLTSSIAHNVAVAGAGGAVDFGSGSLNIDSMLLEHNSVVGFGGAISANGDVRIRNTTIYKNSAGFGGGISQNGGTLDIEAVAIDSNQAMGDGGGLAINGTLVGELRNSSVTNNTSESRGGGLFIVSHFKLKRVLVGSNSATESGGGIQVFQSQIDNPFDDVEIDQTTVFRNRAANGGGIAHQGDPLHITNSTISENYASKNGSAIYGADAIIAAYSTIAFNQDVNAIHKLTAATPFIFQFSLIHNPTVDNCAGDISTIQLATTIDSDGSCSTTRTALTGIDPMLAPLTNNGNDQMSHALLPGSPAIGIGGACPQFDQHDTGRPSINCDLGAFQSPLVPTAVQVASQSTQIDQNAGLFGVTLLILILMTMGAIVHRD